MFEAAYLDHSNIQDFIQTTSIQSACKARNSIFILIQIQNDGKNTTPLASTEESYVEEEEDVKEIVDGDNDIYSKTLYKTEKS